MGSITQEVFLLRKIHSLKQHQQHKKNIKAVIKNSLYLDVNQFHNFSLVIRLDMCFGFSSWTEDNVFLRGTKIKVREIYNLFIGLCVCVF